MHAVTLLVLFALAAPLLAVQFTSCLDEHFVKIASVDIDPVIIPAHSEGSAVVTGYSNYPLSKGFANVTVTQNGKEVVNRQYDLCRELMHHDSCPVNGKFEIRVPIFWPRDDASEGEYSVEVELFDFEHRLTKVACFNFDVQVATHDGENCAPCGTVMTSTAGGCPAYSNGANQGTGDSCAGQGASGLQYQCVELVQRCWGTHFPVAYASQMCANHPANFCQVGNPQNHDVYVSAAYTYGHTAIVQSANGGYVDVVEQNGSCNGRSTYAIGGAECFLRPC